MMSLRALQSISTQITTGSLSCWTPQVHSRAGVGGSAEAIGSVGQCSNSHVLSFSLCLSTFQTCVIQAPVCTAAGATRVQTGASCVCVLNHTREKGVRQVRVSTRSEGCSTSVAHLGEWPEVLIVPSHLVASGGEEAYCNQCQRLSLKKPQHASGEIV